jgi:hypothetical protein
MARMGIVTKPATEVTMEDMKRLFPKKKESITEELVTIINDANNNPFFSGDEFMNTIITYKDVMEKQKASLKDYLAAIRFCAYLESEDYNLTEAYKKSHCHTEFVRERLDSPTNSAEYKQLTNAASRYRKRPLIVQILTQSQLGLHLMFQGEQYRAINVLSDIMVNGRSEMARVAAAKELLANTKAPETHKLELDIGIRNESAMESLNAQLAQFALQSMEQLKNGRVDLSTLGAMTVAEEVIDAEVE